ncbi:MAG: winged helix-turn-helix domain-containing protein [Acidiferrobacterales bacterium]|nr:winged helix-turn-helix domain-containing protein [Acidiferrobacterales bacterium]
MLWQLGHRVFDDERGVIRSDNNEVLLEPKATALLRFFVKHPKQDLSRDELIEKVWHGQIVSDNAINRVIVQLRKALGDEVEPRSFIKTVPKIGYRLILEPTQHQAGRMVGHRGAMIRYLPFMFVLMPLMLIAWTSYSDKNTGPVLSISIQPLSREVGWQFDADLAPNMQQLIYSVNNERGSILYMQNLKNGAIQQVGPDFGQAHGGRWSHDGRYFVYIYHNDDRCEFHKVSVGESGEVEATEAVQNCRLNSETNFALSLDDEILYFVERASVFSPFEAYALDLQEQQRWKLVQPLASSLGNHYLDVHPETGKVLLLSEPKPGTSIVYEIDVPANSYQKIQEFDYDLYSAIWGHADNTVIHPAEHPSYQLLETNINTGESRVLVSDSRRISTPRRVNNGEDYLFASYIYNRDISLEDYQGTDFNSAVMDYLPEYSNAGEHLAFVSKRGGFSKILILDIALGQIRTLKSEDQGLTFYNLSWSPDDSKIAANTSKGILIYELDSDTQDLLSIQQLTYAVDWYDEVSVTYSEHVNGAWQIYRRVLDDDQVQELDSNAIFMQSNNGIQLSISPGQANGSNGSVYDLSQCSYRYLGRYQSNIKFDNGKVYCPQRDSIGNIIMIEAGKEPVVFSDQYDGVEYYSIVKGKSATAYPASMSSDVMRTDLE